MVDILNTFVAIILSVVALTPIFLLVVLLNRTNVKPGTDPTVIKKLEDMDVTIASDTNNALDQVSAKLEDFETRIAELEDQRVNVKGFKSNTLKISIGLFFSVIIYYMNNFFNVMGKTEKIPIILSVWGPIIFLIIISFIYTVKINEK